MIRRLLALSSLLLALCLSLAAQQEQTLLYPSVDQHGDTLTLSGRVMVPDQQPKGIILIPHYTIWSNEDAPSNEPTYEAKFFKKDYVLLMPDYIGFGVTRDRVHPYLAGELTARNCIDMVLGAQPMLDSLQLGIPLDSIYIMGYSQGGAAALWTLRVIEESYADRIHVRGCFVGAGPYDVALTFDEALARERVLMPALIPLMLVGTDEAYDLHLNRSELLKKTTEKKYQKYIASKDYSMVKIFFKMANHRMHHWLKPAAFDKSHPQTQRLYEGLQRSSIVTASDCPDWTPQAPLYVFHSTEDDIVTIHCAEHLQRCFPNLPNVTYDFSDYGNHIKASAIFYTRVRKNL